MNEAKLSNKVKFSYAIGGFGKDMMFAMSTIMMFYFNDLLGINAAFLGVMFMVVLGTFEWASFKMMKRVPLSDAFVIVLVSGVTVVTDLAIAVCVGVIVSALVFAWNHAKHIYTTNYIDEQGAKVYELHGPLFFGSVASFLEQFDISNDSSDVIVEFKNYSKSFC